MTIKNFQFLPFKYAVLLLLLLLTGNASFASHDLTDVGFSVQKEGVISHQMDIQIQPESHNIQVIDEIALTTASDKKIIFTLHKNFTPLVLTENVQLKPLDTAAQLKFNKQSIAYHVVLPDGLRTFKLAYQGKINSALESTDKELSRGFRNTSGIISSEGVYLSGKTNWYPEFLDQTGVIFDMRINLPEKWSAVSQGKRTQHRRSDAQDSKQSRVRWQESHIQQEIYLIAAQFVEYEQQTDGITAQVYLRSADETLANKYLNATAQFLKMYQDLLGAYPYSKFALIENFWETGYGMPSFTLLGPKVIRLPFIINSSYPHEILHNWWGNSVYVDYEHGNWSEGLTSYLADHLIKEQQGQGTAYRQQSLQKYSDYAAKGHDFPVSEFRGRHDSVSEAVGYGKVLMIFHMLRIELGDELFVHALKNFYKLFQFHQASFEDWSEIFELAARKPFKHFFKQWVHRAGAPELSLKKAQVTAAPDGYVLSFELVQDQIEPVYQLTVPFAVTLDDQVQAFQSKVFMTEKHQQFEVKLKTKPLRLDIDPQFDVFRKLLTEETPPAFTQVFGSKKMLVVLPGSSSSEEKNAYKQFAEAMKKMGSDSVVIQWDDEIKELAENYAVTLLGLNNKFLKHFKNAAKGYDVQFGQKELILNHQSSKPEVIPYADHSIALTVRRNNKYKTPISLIASSRIDALPGLARKLPHYHKYSFISFAGVEPSNQNKGRWPIKHSPMTINFTTDAQQSRGALNKRSALAEKPSLFSAYSMLDSINYLASDELKGRGFGSEGLNKSADYIARAFEKAGLLPGGDGESFFQSWTEKGGETEQETELKNVVAIIPGTNPDYAGQSVVIGAHYDHLGLGWPDVRQGNKGQIHNGADDNASGVAVLLELARAYGETNFKTLKPERSIIFVAFSAEEAGRKGSKQYLKLQKKFPVEQIIGMLNLDTVGRLEGRKLLVLGTGSATQWPHIFRGIGFVTGVQISLVKEELDASDQISFHEAGIPAVQLFSGVNLDYHRPSDTSEKIDLEGLLQIAKVSHEVIEYLASRGAPMTVNLNTASHQPDRHDKLRTVRKVSLGTIPDFTWTGGGYKLDGVVPGSPADIAELKKGDVILQIDLQLIDNIKDISITLKALKTGQVISIKYLRNNAVRSTTATLISK